jgi:hypothetical protein
MLGGNSLTFCAMSLYTTNLEVQFALVVNACCYGGAAAAISVKYPTVRSKIIALAVPLLYSAFVIWMSTTLNDKGTVLSLCFCGVPVRPNTAVTIPVLTFQVSHGSRRPHLELCLSWNKGQILEGAPETAVWPRQAEPVVRASAKCVEEREDTEISA